MVDVFAVIDGNILSDLGDNTSGTYTRIHYLLNALNESQNINLKSIKFKQFPQSTLKNIFFNNIIKSIVALKSITILIKDKPLVFFAYPYSLHTIQNRMIFKISEILDLKIILDIHDTIEQVNVLGKGKPKLTKKIEKECIEKSSLVIILNKPMWNSLKKVYNLNENIKIVFIPNAFEYSFITLYPTKYKNQKDDFVNIGYMGGLTKNRGIDILVQSCVNLHEKYPYLKLFLFGTYGEGISDDLKDVIENSDFIIRKEIPRKDIPMSLKDIDIFVMPYNPEVKYLNESSPMKFYEYIGCCKPIICTKCESLVDVGQNDSILYVDYNIEDFTKKIELLIKNPKLREYMSEGLYDIRLDHTWEKRADELLHTMMSLSNNLNE